MRVGSRELSELKRFGREPDYLSWKNGVQVLTRREGAYEWGDWYTLYGAPWRELRSLSKKGLMDLRVEAERSYPDQTRLVWKARTSPKGKDWLERTPYESIQGPGIP